MCVWDYGCCEKEQWWICKKRKKLCEAAHTRNAVQSNAPYSQLLRQRWSWDDICKLKRQLGFKIDRCERQTGGKHLKKETFSREERWTVKFYQHQSKPRPHWEKRGEEKCLFQLVLDSELHIYSLLLFLPLRLYFPYQISNVSLRRDPFLSMCVCLQVFRNVWPFVHMVRVVKP